MQSATLIALAIFAYLLGAIPFGFIFGKLKGIDLRKTGSGNIGATNAGRVLGKKYAYICFGLDALKGFVPMILAKLVIGEQASMVQIWLWLFVGSSAILGHIFPVYLKFKGGKGVSTSLGMVLGLWPYYTVPGLLSFAVWIVTLYLWRYVSLSSIVAALSFPAGLIVGIIALDNSWSFSSLWPLVFVALLMASLVVVRHAENIKRLLDGSESKVWTKKS